MKLNKKFLILTLVIVFFIFLITIFYNSGPSEYATKNTISIDKNPVVENAPLWEQEGTIVHKIEDWGNFWGLEISFLDRPFGSRKLRIKYLPEEFQIEGLKVRVKYGKADVVGSKDWDVIIDIINIQKI